MKKDIASLQEAFRSDAFLKNRPLVFHACDPFSPAIKLADGLWCIPHLSPDFMGFAHTYLVCGEERAALIDTGYGIGDMKALCTQLTDLPVVVVNTHAHPDHTGGNSLFGGCMMHEKDAAMPDLLRVPQPIAMIRRDPDNFYTEADVALPGRGIVTPLKDGDIIDLGGTALEVIHLPGHTPGSIALIEKRRGVLFTGDAIMTYPCSTLIVPFAGTSGNPDCTVEAFLSALEALEVRMPEIRTLCPGHCDIEAAPALIPELIACCRDIIANPGIGGASRFRPGAKMHFHGGAGITYDENRIFR